MTSLERAPIVTGYDGSERSLDAIALTRLLASLLGLDVVVLSVLTFAPTETTWAVYERMLREDEERLASEARAALHGVANVELLTLPGASPARELHDLAESRRARLLVLGSTHRGPLGTVVPGTVADRLLGGAPCPIAVAPRGYAENGHELRAIAVAYDGSVEAKLALSVGSELAAAAGASIGLTAVADPYDPLPAGTSPEAWAAIVASQEGLGRGRRRMRAALDAALESIPADLEVESEVVDGDPKAALLEASGRVDLLLMGSRGYGPLGRVLLGGVSSAVIRKAGCPIIVTARSSIHEPGGPVPDPEEE